jgi:hypothetical protein
MPKKRKPTCRAPHRKAHKPGSKHRIAPGQLSFLSAIFALFQSPVK